MTEHINGAASSCGNCRHFHRYQTGQPNGTCHRHPPTVLIIGGMQHPITQVVIPRTDGFWAPTNEAEICGEHSPGVARTKAPIATADQVAEAMAGLETEGSA